MILLPIVISYLIGRELLRIFLPESRGELFYHFIAFGIGAAVSAQIVFLILIICHQLNALAVVITHIIGLIVLFCMGRKKAVQVPKSEDEPKLSYAIFIGCLFLALAAPFALSIRYGGWDAWALWNFRANFIYRAGTAWQNIFHFSLHGHQPWLLPFYLLYGWSLTAGENYLFPLIVALSFSLCILGLLFYALYRPIGNDKSFLAGIFLCSIPFFIQHAVSQYADIVAAFYLLAAAVLLGRPALSLRQFFLAGFMLGSAAFSKDEGMVLSLLAVFFLFFCIPRNSWGALLGGYLIMMPAIAAVKIWMTGDVAGVNKIYLPYLMDLGRWWFVIDFILKYLFLKWWWGATWFLLAVVLWIKRKNLLASLKAMLYATAVFLLIFMALYVVVFNNLPWRMVVSVDRLFFQITPLLTYITFACL